jgi:hypothetical protein
MAWVKLIPAEKRGRNTLPMLDEFCAARWLRLIFSRARIALSPGLHLAPALGWIAFFGARSRCVVAARPASSFESGARLILPAAFIAETIVARPARERKDEQFIHEQNWQKT